MSQTAGGGTTKDPLEDDVFIGTDVTSSHFVPKTSRDKCQNKACGQLFSLLVHLRRPHHCRRCGEVFCRPCLQYSRRLNALAQPDPNGIPCKVCFSCFDDRGLSLGCTTRSQRELFLQLRKQTKDEMADIIYEYELATRKASERPRFWKEQFKVDILQECLRLLQGFKSSVGGSDTLKAVNELTNRVNIPSWQKSPFWTLESQSTRCRQCGGKLGPIKKIRNCRVCGLSLCKVCSQKVLLLYFEDVQPRNKDNSPHLAIIRYIGCPDIEPNISLLLRCCGECKEEIVRKQIEDERWYLQKPKPPDLHAEMVRLDGHFRQLIKDIRENVDELSSLLNDQFELSVNVFEDDSIKRVMEFESKRMKLKIDIERLKAKKDFYMEIKSELGKISKMNII